MPKIIIRDSVDIDTVINDSTIPENKTSLTDSEEVRYTTVDLRHAHLKIFSLLTTSDKEINLRIYPDKHVEDMAKKHSWTSPYFKPLQQNHDIYVDCNARFMDSWYLKHTDLVPKYGFTKLPKGVIDEFERRGAFKEGTGSTIGMAETANLDFKRKIIDGTYLTTSQGASTDSLTCNICGKDYRSIDCNHFRGSTYSILDKDNKTVIGMKKCVPFTGALEAIEDSTVNHPANDTSTLLVFDTKNNRVVTMDNISEYSDIFNIEKNSNDSKINNSDNKSIDENISNIQDSNKNLGLNNEEINKIKDLLQKGITPNIEELDNNKQTNKNNVNDNSINIGGKMPSNKRNSAVKRLFKDDMKKLNVINNEKIDAYFETLEDSEIDIVMDLLGFISDNAETIKDDSNEEKITDKEIEKKDSSDKEIEKNDSSDKSIKDDKETVEKTNKLQDELKEALKIICDLKGINNEIPDLASVKDIIKKENKPKISNINDFGF